MANGEIVIKIIDSGNGISAADENRAEKKTTKSKTPTAVESAFNVAVLKKAYENLKDISLGEINYEVNKFLTLTDNYLGQQYLNVAKGVVGKTVSTAGSIAAGAAVGGPIGAGIMAVVSAARLGIDIYQNYNQQDIRLRQMDAALSFNRERAGYSLTDGSVGRNR